MQSEANKTCEYDLVVIGAGFCGSVLAIKADDLGLRVKVIDTQARYPDHFRAEKLETDQFEALAAFGLIDRVRPKESPLIERVQTFTGNTETIDPQRKHRGIQYADTVNAFRDVLLKRQLLEIRKVSEISDGTDACEIQFDDGTSVQTGVAALATGMAAGFRKSLGLEYGGPLDLVSMTFGFHIEPRSAAGLPFTAFNIRPQKMIRGLQYITFFPIGDQMRVNLFTCWDPRGDQVREFKASPSTELARLFPALETHIGAFRIVTDIQAYATRYYRLPAEHLHRTVLVGDAYQSVSPATGIGLSKCLVDAQVLVSLLPQLLENPAARLDLEEYYRDERKTQTDDLALRRWRWANELATSKSIKTRFKIFKKRIVPMIRKVTGE